MPFKLKAKRRHNDEVRRRRGELGVQGDPKTSDAREWPVRTSLPAEIQIQDEGCRIYLDICILYIVWYIVFLIDIVYSNIVCIRS